ncbi:MAG: hypothetical protein AAB802_04070, partial [Patescibacteria group bacterium]
MEDPTLKHEELPVEEFDLELPQQIISQLGETSSREAVLVQTILSVHRHFIERGKSHLLVPYYRLMQVCLENTSLSESSVIFPFLSEELALGELETWEQMGDFKETALEIAEYTIRNGEGSRMYSQVSFQNSHYNLYYDFFRAKGERFREDSLFPIGDVWEFSEKLTPEERELFHSLHKKYPQFGGAVLSFFNCFISTQKHYPGGMEAMARDIERHAIPEMGRFADQWVFTIEEYRDEFALFRQQPELLDEFYEFARLVGEKLGGIQAYYLLNHYLPVFFEFWNEKDPKKREQARLHV